MEQEHDNDMQEMIDEFTEDLGRSRNRDEDLQYQGNTSRPSFHEKPLLWGSIGIVFLIAVFSLFSRGSDDSLKDKVDLLSDQITQIEQKINFMEGTIKESSANQSGISSLKKSVSRLENSVKPVQGRINDLTKRIEKFEKGLISVQPEIKDQTKAKVAAKKSDKTMTYTVRKGDTLYKIAQKYNVKVNEIQRMNNMGNNQDIYPGQELIISE